MSTTTAPPRGTPAEAPVSTNVPGAVRDARGRTRTRTPDLLLTLVVRGFDGLPRLRPDRGAPAGAAVRSRLLGRPAVVVRGADGVRAFYDSSLVARRGAVPAPLSNVLFGRGAVHGLDDAAHRVRKELFTTALAPERVDGLVAAAGEEWARAVRGWPGRDRVEVFDEAVGVLGRAVLRWAGAGAGGATDTARAHELATIVDGFGSAGPRFLRARRARGRCERWAARAVRDVRSGRRLAPAGSALALVAAHREPDGRLLDERTAAVELLNVLRPTVAVAWLVAQAAVALHEHPRWRDAVAAAAGGPEPSGTAVAVAHEVRRRYPFVPALATRLRRDAEVAGHRLRAGDRVVLDVVSTHRDPAAWPSPEEFDPGRFDGAGVCPVAHGFAPQGGGDARTGHRCPGEPATVRLLAQAAEVLSGLRFTVPPQETRMPARPVPSRPADGFVVTEVAPAAGEER
ncbi:cytochrome P450 [Paenibacillus sp. TRM 82003]|uniref:cytochrome P450 n=1 Tax=Kineococcus sp. TRM81007 TaxID=2925831 RepID=UPI001F57AE81|nr:cytochrome P450 [Kineococcus sp. TRM81007]MCI2238192.1 cytochrome P450 [Kineococcus sp. TRM81007]MCI3920576.1 cytochrome P450 [Paenibacillus sp. TRM 82003]